MRGKGNTKLEGEGGVTPVPPGGVFLSPHRKNNRPKEKF